MPGLPLSTLFLRQRGCSLIMTSAFYNMAEEREEGGLLLESTELFPLWIKQPWSGMAHGLSTQAHFGFLRFSVVICSSIKWPCVTFDCSTLLFHKASVKRRSAEFQLARIKPGVTMGHIALLPANDVACAPQAGLHL